MLLFLFELLLLPRGCYRHIRVNELVRSLKREQSLSKSVQTSFPSPELSVLAARLSLVLAPSKDDIGSKVHPQT